MFYDSFIGYQFYIRCIMSEKVVNDVVLPIVGLIAVLVVIAAILMR